MEAIRMRDVDQMGEISHPESEFLHLFTARHSTYCNPAGLRPPETSLQPLPLNLKLFQNYSERAYCLADLDWSLWLGSINIRTLSWKCCCHLLIFFRCLSLVVLIWQLHLVYCKKVGALSVFDAYIQKRRGPIRCSWFRFPAKANYAFQSSVVGEI